MQSSKSYIKNSGDILRKIKGIPSVLSNDILVTAEMVGLYPWIPHDSGLKAFKNVLDKPLKIYPLQTLSKWLSLPWGKLFRN